MPVFTRFRHLSTPDDGAPSPSASSESASAAPAEADAPPSPETGSAAAETEVEADAEIPAEPGAETEAEPGPEAETAAASPPTAAATETSTTTTATPHSTTVLASLGARLAHLRTWRARYPETARVLRWTTTVLAAALVFVALLLPNNVNALHLNRFTRIPAEAIVVAAVVVALPRRPRVVVAAVSGVGLGVLTVLNFLDMGFTEYLGRGFNAVLDWELLPDAQSYVADSMGRTTAIAATVGLVVLVLLLLVVMALATVRISDLLARNTQTATRATLVAGTVWITCATLGLEVAGVPVASDRAAGALQIQARRVRDTIRDEASFAKEAGADRFGGTPGDQLVPDLRGKDMIFTFIESYGRSAIEDPVIAPGVDKTLKASTAALAKAGFHAKSGWLTSATYGGSSWLGHSTTMSGLWIDNQQRYRTVMAGDHLSLTKAFQKTGDWDTVGVMPGIQKGWPEAKYYGLDKVYNAFQMGYKGPKFSWSTMPDQYALEAFQRLEHSRKRDKPLMSEIILTSSHQPWAPIPKTVGWDQLGDGSVFGPIEKAGNKPSDVIADSTRSKQEYGKSIQYSVTSLTQWLERYGTDDTVLVFLGDHQPIARVSGNHASRDVPVSIVAKDPKVLDKVASWNWSDGLMPAHNAPVWKMSSFRDRFLTAYGSTPHPTKD
ncbi:CDP-alcohol phosphatidyltransferase [Streptomyces sp. NPDC087903]|uniref:CDP-alcohol phosphatidyltransferase n=1 Tax=Streptomyces sp. NPDC087903 TaxID=3365819 RepID=UPI00380924C7